ncbi:MAG: hypothetical protein HS102_19295 [Planctomycetia bacterium]|nr:hypothetical protein [Planctomycetia bacterium]
MSGDGEERPPGVPDVVNSPQWMDYAAHGRDQLLSTQTLYFEGDEYNTLDRVAVETFEYAGYGTPGAFYVAAHMLYRQRTTYRWDAKLGKGGRWWTQIVKNTRYEYDSFSNPDRLQKQEYSYTVYDVPEEELPLGDVLHEGAIGEFSGYDELLGRRIATWRCEAVDSTVIDWGPSGGDCKDETECKARTMMFDYYGLSQRVAAVRRSSWRCADRAGTPNRAAPVRKRALRAGLAGSGLSHPCVNEGDAPCNPYEKGDAPCSPYERGDAPCNTYEKADAPCNPYEKGDAPCNTYEKADAPCNPYEKGDAPCSPYESSSHGFHKSYTYGPVGVTTRTVETQDTDPEDNFDHWVLPDLFGGTSALLLLYDAQSHERTLATEHFDAFGVRVAKGTSWGLDHDASRYRWRSQEGSETDDLHRNDPDVGVYLSPPTLVYMQTRHYDPALGRFIMADSIPMGAFSPQGLNRYAYCTNDPVNFSDRTGKWLPILGAVLFAVGFYLGTVLAEEVAADIGGGGLSVVDNVVLTAGCTALAEAGKLPAIFAGMVQADLAVGAGLMSSLIGPAMAMFFLGFTLDFSIGLGFSLP